MTAHALLAPLLISASLLCAGCGAGGGGTEVVSNKELDASPSIDTSDKLFQADKLLQVSITMDPADYDLLRQEGRYMTQIISGCADDFEYSHYKATVSVDGQVLEDVDVRKKGFLGSLSASRPSFKLNFDTHDPGRRLESLERMTLNNNRQDPSNTHQCITYELFRAAGLAAPRCSFAEVTMNGEHLGIYSHVESIKRHFLQRNYSSDEGNLYEAQLADFGEFGKENFQLKTNVETNDRSDLDAVVNALQADDENLPGLLEQIVDIDEFITFWAMESISGHWDSATGNANNYFVYNDPSDGLFHYIPWGADASLEQDHALARGTGPLYRYISIPARLFNIPKYRQKYNNRVLELLDEIWNAKAVNDEIDRIRDLTGTDEEDMEAVRFFVAEQEGRIRAAVAGERRQVERTIVDSPSQCRAGELSTISGSFTDGVGFFEYVNEQGTLQTIPAVLTAPSINGGPISIFNGIAMTMIGNLDGQRHIAFITIEENEFGSGEIPFHGIATTLFLVDINGGGAGVLFTGAGSISFDVPPVLGEPATLHFSADLWLNSNDDNSPLGGL